MFLDEDEDFLQSLPLNVRDQTLMQLQKKKKTKRKNKRKKQKLEKQ
jgi:hypothetical protein